MARLLLMNINDDFRTRTALVAYGSETGNAYDYAEELGRSLERIHFLVHPSLSDYSVIAIVVSTTGQGDLPINARTFWKSLLRKKLPRSYLDDVQFTTFGLGDSSYPKFNWAARKLHKRLIQLGAHEIYPRGESDEQHEEGRDASFVPWVTDFRRHLLYEFPLAKGVEPIPEHVLLESKWLLSLGQGKSIDFSKILMDSLRNGDTLPHDSQQTRCETEPSQGLVKDAATPSDWRIQLTLEENQRMTPNSHWQDVRHLAFSSPLEVAYGPGDVLTIYPQNTQEDVDQILRRMDWTDIAEKEIQFTPTGTVSRDGLYPSPPISLASGSRMTLRKLLTEHLDLTAIPRRSFFSLVAHFTADQFHKDRLLEFTKPEYIDELYDYTTRPRRSILEVLQEFESVKIPWQWAANILPELRGRQFSIASGGRLKHGPEGSTRFELLVAIVKYKTVIKKIREGICTRYLAALRPGAQILVTLQGGGLGITKAEAQRPVVMIGPGTGVAPMRSLIWERRLWTEEMRIQSGANANGLVNCTKNVGKSLLLYGCRNQSADYFYREEWMHLKDMMPVQVEAAFSRDQSRKIYVQDLISQHSEEVFRLLHDLGGIVYVCGSSGKMPTAVRAALVDVFKKHGAMYEDAAGKFLETVEKEGRYKQETW